MAEFIGHTETRAARVAASIYLVLFPIPVVCFVAALLTDIAYSAGAFLMWMNFSEWLIAAGLAFGALAAIVLLIEFLVNDVVRAGSTGWWHLALFYAALIVELVNSLVHTADGWTAVVPTGLVLSIVGAVLALAAAGTVFLVPITWVERRKARP